MDYNKLMTTELFERLLTNGEGYLIDYKKEQYLFDKADFTSKGITDSVEKDKKKSEIIKDILAFANTEKSFDGFILIGFKNGSFFNVNKHFDDAVLHEFINEKTNIRVKFEYKSFEYEGNSVGIIHIHKEQNGLIYAKNDFGSVRANLVYIRDGSATKTLTPDEIIERSGKKDEIKRLNSIQPIFDGGIGGLINFEKKEYTSLFVSLWNEGEPIKKMNIEWLDELNHHPNYYKNTLTLKEQIRIELKEESFKPLPSFFKFRICYVDKEGNNCNKLFHFHIQSLESRKLEEVETIIK